MTADKEFELLLVRHGQSMGNAGISSGETPEDRQDTDLSAAGIRQAELLAHRFSGYPLDAVFSSGLLRAVHTASIVVREQPQNGAHTVQILPLLTECNVGECYCGRPIETLSVLFPQAGFVPEWDDPRTVLYNDETIDEAYNFARARHVLQYLHTHFHSGERVMVVAHGIFNTVFLMCALGIADQRFDPDFENTSVTRLIFYKCGTGPWGFDVRLSVLNDFSHLHSDFPNLCFEAQEGRK